MKNTIINGKKYTVEHVFNMVSNWVFTDKDRVEHLIDGEDVSVWAEEKGIEHKGIDTAIAYAKELASESESGIFYWKRTYYSKELGRKVEGDEIDGLI